jgi:trehalose/maltose transport system substrate-binding protein
VRKQAALRSAASVAVAAMALALSSCGGDDGSGPTELHWFISTQPGGSVEAVAEACSKQSGGRYEIVPELQPSDATLTHEQLIRRLGAEDSTFDLIGMDVVWTAEFANAGWIKPWEGAAEREVSQGVFDTVLKTATFENKLYGAPFNSNTQLLWYRTDQTPKPPQTWEEVISEAERLDTTIAVQGNRYEGYTVWVNAMIESAGGHLLSGPETVDLEEEPTTEALQLIGEVANSPAALAALSTSDEDVSRLAFEAGDAYFMVNYTFAYSSAAAEAPDIAKVMGAAPYPRVVPNRPPAPPLGGFNIGVGEFTEHEDLAFEAARCLTAPEQQLTVTELDGLPPVREALYDSKVVKKAFPGFAQLTADQIALAAPRPATPAYTDVSLAVQRALHPPDSIDPEDPEAAYDELLEKLIDAAKREGLI